MPVYNLDEAQKVLARPGIGRNLAVVVCGFGYGEEAEAKQQQVWASVLSGLGYRRVTFIRLGTREHVNGLPILNEMNLESPKVTGG